MKKVVERVFTGFDKWLLNSIKFLLFSLFWVSLTFGIGTTKE